MKSAFFKSQNPILVIDRVGLVGEPLSLKLSKEFLVVFVSRKSLESDTENQNIIHIPFFKRFPVIPDNKYSHIIFIDEEIQDLEFLPKIIDKVKNVNADFIFAQGLSVKGEYAVNKILQTYPSAKVAIFGDIFDSELILKKEIFSSAINKFIYQAQRFGRIQISGEGLRETYPVFLPDLVDSLIDLVFGLHKSNSLYYIFPHPTTELSLAHMIQKINPEITIDFIRNVPGTKNISYPLNGKNLLGDKYLLAKKIRGIDIKKKVKAQGNPVRKDAKKIKNLLFFTIWALIFLLFSPFIFTMFFSFLGSGAFNYAKTEIDRGNFANAKSSTHLSQTFFYVGKQALNILLFQAKFVGQENNLKRFSEDVDLGYKISENISQAFNSETYFSKVLTGTSKKPIEDLAQGQSYLKNSIIALDRIKAEGKIPASILQNLEILSPLIKFLSATGDIMPSILGMERQKTYLILFQNNLELRPGGGHIDSYGILKFNMGKITEFSLHDVYDADNQLKGHVEPPFTVRRYLQQQHWYMRDSNFDIDFAKIASSSSNFLFVETGQKADGVIAVDTSFVKNILQAIGPVYVASYKKTVDENNFYILMQKTGFSRSLNEAIVKKIAEGKPPYLLIAQAVSNSLIQKHLLFAFEDWQNIFTVNGWSPSLWDERKGNSETINDFLGINEANLGMNKVNYYIKRLISQKITIEDSGNISEELTINYKNLNTATAGGDYKNYLRIILPKNTKLTEIAINDSLQKIVDAVTAPAVYEAKNFKAPQGLEVEKVIQDDKAVFGFMVNIPAGEIVKVKLKYTLPGSVSGLNTFSYNLKLFKQPGVDDLPYVFSLIYPKSFNFIKRFDGAIGGEDKVSYSEKIIGDKNLIIDFAKK